jgi:tetratricopeptide (TPR) repeat protein
LFFRRAIAARPSGPIAYFHAADAAYKLGMNLEAEKYVSKAVSFAEDTTDAILVAQSRFNRGLVMKFKLSRDEQAMSDFKSVISSEGSPKFLKERARAFLAAISKDGV